jgi:hypothetical protein
MCDSCYAMHALPSVCIKLNSDKAACSMRRCGLHGAQRMPLAVPVRKVSRVRMVARNQERKTASQPQETVCCVP